MRPITFLLLVYALIFGMHSAHAMGKKLDLNEVQGTYTTDVDGKNALNCVENITVVYNAQNHTLDSDAFHFADIDQGNKIAVQEAIPAHSAYQDDYNRTETDKDGVFEDLTNHEISGNAPSPFINGPLDNPGIIVNGQQQIPQIVSDYSDTVERRVKYDEKAKKLVYTVSIGDLVDDSQTCSYVRTN
jgi:hypothetical protein